MNRSWGRGSVVWATLDPVSGRDSPASGRGPQGGRRPAVVVASQGYLDAVTTLLIVVPVTTVDRGWPNQVPLRGDTGLERTSWAMTEQPRTIDRARLRAVAGGVDAATLTEIDVWLRDFLGVR